jgi:L-amino acid N-acyltransferase YncA
MTNLRVRQAEPLDAASIARIYNYYVLNTVVTFEEEAVSTEVMAHRMAEVGAIPLPWLVAELDGAVIGYAYASRWKVRSAYRHSVETTVYLEHGLEGRGIGTKLYSELLAILRGQRLHVAIGGAAQPNKASVALHEKLGFEHAGTFRQVGFKQNRWVDVAYWQVLL